MTDTQVWAPPPPQPQPARPRIRVDTAVLRGAALIVGVLAALGAVLGLVWAAWSPAGPPGYVLPNHGIEPLGESEAFVAGDGRYAIITAAVAIIAGLVVWFWRAMRGPLGALALAVGGFLGALLTEAVGTAIDGGSTSGAVNTIIHQLPLEVRIHALRLLEPLVAVLVYSVCVAFAASDDLGHPDSVRRAGQPQDGRRDGDAAGALQQEQFATEQGDRQP